LNDQTLWHQLPQTFRQIAAEREGAILLETARQDSADDQSFLFLDPICELVALNANDLNGLLHDVDTHVAASRFVAGYFAYECGEEFVGLSVGCAPLRNLDRPLAWLGAFRDAIRFDHRTGTTHGSLPETTPRDRASLSNPGLKDVSLQITREAYEAKIAQVQEYLLGGHTYQVNFTDKICDTLAADPLSVYTTLLAGQPVSFAAYVNLAHSPILSFSPELFYRTSQGIVLVRPMKGTWPCGLNIEGERQAAEQLRNDEKNRSEHITIVDLLRNDVGRICEPGSVRVERLLDVERYMSRANVHSPLRCQSAGSGSYPKPYSIEGYW
jgi:para-aminobenzoate synthetase / 4-amino-4-deoxychorismate lyase